MRLTTGSCSARPRPLPFDGEDFGELGCVLPGCVMAPGTICSLTARPRTPPALAIIIRLASGLSDISIIAAEDATPMVSSPPSTRHSPASRSEESIVCPAAASAFRTAERTSSPLASFASGCFSSAATTAGAADPITTGWVLTAAGDGREGDPALSEASDRGVPLRAESAAKGEMKGRGVAGGSGFLASGAIASFRSRADAGSGVIPLNNCSTGSSLCAWESFKSPNSR